MVVRHRRGDVEEKRGSFDWLKQAGVERIPKNQASMFELNDVDRSPYFFVGGADALRCSDTWRDTPVEKLIDVPGLLLYSLEVVQGEAMMVFLQVPSVSEVFQAPFIDRGVRALVETGSTVYVARLDAVEGMPGFVPVHKLSPNDQARFSIVWNTGRCGSTLMHKMLRKLGVLSFSEPYWVHNIESLPSLGMDHDMIGRAFGVCVAMDVALVRGSLPAHAPLYGAASTLGCGHTSINFKSKGAWVMEAVMKAVPNAKYILMYRDVRKIIESLGSIFQKEPSAFGKLLGVLNPWRRQEMKIKLPLPKKKGALAPTYTGPVGQALASGDLVLPSNPFVSVMVLVWMQTLCVWKKMVKIGTANSGCTASLRLDEFAKKRNTQDPELTATIIRFFLGGGIEVGEDAIATALEAFNTHSQAGDLMEKSSHKSGIAKKRFLTPADVSEIERATAAVPDIGSPDYIIPGSMGVPAS